MILNIDQKMCQFYTHGKEIIFLFFSPNPLVWCDKIPQSSRYHFKNLRIWPKPELGNCCLLNFNCCVFLNLLNLDKVNMKFKDTFIFSSILICPNKRFLTWSIHLKKRKTQIVWLFSVFFFSLISTTANVKKFLQWLFKLHEAQPPIIVCIIVL